MEKGDQTTNITLTNGQGEPENNWYVSRFSVHFCGINFPPPTEHEEQLAERRLKLDYNSLVSSSETTLQTWEGLDSYSLPLHVFCAGFLTASNQVPDRASVRAAVGLGIPRSKRGEAWQLMAKMSKAKAPSADKFPSLTMVTHTLKLKTF